MAAKDYRKEADKLREKAARARNPAVREQMLLMAHDWDKLADAAEEMRRRREAEAG